MSGTDQSYGSWRLRGLRFFNWLMTAIPLVPELLNVHSKTTAIIKAWHLISRNGLTGDYLEFGVFQGDTFRICMRTARNSFRSSPARVFEGRFFAFDSFAGLPEADSYKDQKNIFAAGEYAASKKSFLNLIKREPNFKQVTIVDGWFSETLQPQTLNQHQLSKVAIVNIDCDLYESTVDCLRFVTPLLQEGSILMFDDWFLMGGSLRKGEAQAAAEWLVQNPEIQLVPFLPYGIAGQMFIVNLGKNDLPFYLPRPNRSV